MKVRRIAVFWFGVAFFLFTFRLAASSLWYDEGYAVYVARMSPAEILFWSSRDVLPPLHEYLLALWLPLAGRSEFSLRYLSAWMGVVMVAGMFRLGRDLFRKPAGLGAAVLATLSPFYLVYARDGRMYMTLAALGVWSTVFLVRALRSPERWGRWVACAVGEMLTLYAHTTGGFLLLFHGLVVWTAGGRVRRRGLAVVTAAALAWLPWLVYAAHFLGENAGYWPGRLSFGFVLSGAFRGFVTGGVVEGPVAAWFVVLWAGGCLLGLAALLRWAPRRMAFLGAYFAVPVVAMAVLFHAVPKFAPRYLILASPPLFLVPAAGLTQGRPGRVAGVGRWVYGVLGMVVLYSAGFFFRDPAGVNPDFRAAARLVESRRVADERVLIVPGHVFPVWEYYFGPQGWVALPPDPILDVRHVFYYREIAPLLNGLLEGWGGVWLVEWEPWVVDPTDLVPALLAELGEEQPVGEVRGLRVRHYRLGGDLLPPEPSVTPPVASTFDLSLGLLGCSFPSKTPVDLPVEGRCYWEAGGPLPLHLNVSARLVDVNGVEWGRADGPISGPYLVAGRWRAAEPVLGRYVVTPQWGTPPGGFYRLRLLVYESDGRLHGTAEVAPVVLGLPERSFAVTGPSGGSRRLGGLVLDRAEVTPRTLLPGETVWVTADWRVVGEFAVPRLAVGEGSFPVLPAPEAMAAWRPGDYYRTVTPAPLSPYVAGGPLPVRFVSPAGEVGLGTVTVSLTRTFTLPEGVRPTDYHLGEGVVLAGTLVSATVRTWEVMLCWRAERYITRSYTVFVHLVGPDGRVVAQADSIPQGGRHPTDHWLPGEVVPDEYRLVVPPDAPPGRYRLLTGMYEWPSLKRLPVRVAGRRLPDDVIPLTDPPDS